MNNLLPQEVSKEKSLEVPQYVKNDVNLYYLPFFSNKKWELKARRIELELREENKILKWNVFPHPDFGTPAFFEKKLFYAFLSIIEDKGLESILIPFTFRKIARRMGIAETGPNIKNIKIAIKRIISAQIESEGIFYSKEKEARISDFFHLFDRVILKDEEYEHPQTGEKRIAETNYLVLGSWLYSNLKHGYIAKIDYPLFQSMKPLEARLYEFLLPNFYPILSGKSRDEFFKITYSKLCEFLPAYQYKSIAHIGREFIPHIESLVKKGILTHYRVHRSKDGKDWLFYFYPNLKKKPKSLPESSEEHESFSEQRARQKHFRFSSYKDKKKELQIPNPPEATIDLFQFPLLANLNPQFLQSACNNFGVEHVEKTLDILQLQYSKSGRKIKNPEALLYSALSDPHFIPPENYVPRAEREEKKRISKAKAEAERKAEEERERKQQELEQKINKVLSSLPKEKLESLRTRAHQAAREELGKEAFNSLPKILTDIKLKQIIREEYLQNYEVKELSQPEEIKSEKVNNPAPKNQILENIKESDEQRTTRLKQEHLKRLKEFGKNDKKKLSTNIFFNKKNIGR